MDEHITEEWQREGRKWARKSCLALDWCGKHDDGVCHHFDAYGAPEDIRLELFAKGFDLPCPHYGCDH